MGSNPTFGRPYSLFRATPLPDVLGVGFPSLVLMAQLAFGVSALVDLLRSVSGGVARLATVGRLIVAGTLIPLALDGLVFQTNLLWRVLDALDLSLDGGRFVLVGVILAGVLLWSRE